MADAFPISGSIDPKAFPYLLMDLHRHGATGSLKVEGPSYQKALYFRSGRVLFGSSNDPRDQLGAILIETGKITPEQLEDVSGKVGPGNPLAKALADTGYVSQRELSEAARAKVETILSDVIAYTSGNFEFEDGVLPKGAIDLKLSTERLVLAAVRRLTDRNFVLRHLDGLDVVLAPGPDLAARLPALQPEAGGLPEQLDGKRTLKEAAALTRLDEFESAKVACALLFLGLVERAPAAAAEEEAVVRLADDPLFRLAGNEGELDLAVTASASLEAPSSPPTVAMAAAAAPDPRAAEPQAPFFMPEEVPPTVILPPPPVMAAPEPEAPRDEPVPAAEAAPPTIIMPPPAEPFRFEPEVAAPRPPAARPSKEDQAALDALLSAPAIPGPLGSPERRPGKTGSWTPQLGQKPQARRPTRGPSALVLGGATMLMAAFALGAAWYVWGRPAGRAGTTQAARPPATPMPVPSAVATPSSPAPAAPTPAAVTPAPPATPPPSPPTASGPGPASLAKSRALLESGDLAQAARGFAATVKAAPASSASVQLLVACSAETVQKAVQNAGSPELFIIPVHYKGRDCYRLCWGIYESEARAATAARSLPEYFRKGATPRVVAASEIVP